jgi:hypothetical protein
MKFLKFLHIPFVSILKVLVFFVFITHFNSAYASLVTVKIEDAGVVNWESIQKMALGFGSNGPISLNWDPNDDFFTELLAYDRDYSGGAAAFCWYGENCALKLSVTAENTIMQLQSFSLGYYGIKGIVQYKVIDLETDTRVISGSPWIQGNDQTFIDVNATSNKGFMILFGPDGFNGGINNITYSYQSTTVVHTPIPAAAWLFGFSLFAMIGFTRQPKVRLNFSDSRN